MRALIFMLGIMFLETLRTHWGIIDPIFPKSDVAFYAYFFMGCVVLDIIKK